MTIPPRFLDELRARLNVSDIIGRKIKLTRAGREYKACCPFHHEKTPSFYVNDDKQFYHCFGCGAHGSIIDFTMQYDNLSFPEAVEALAGEAGMEVPKASPQEIERAKKQKDLYSLMEEATRWMEGQLRSAENRGAYEYITQRGMDEETLVRFRIGYAPADRQVMRTYLKGQGYSDEQMIEAGVMRPKGQDGQPYAFFRERIMFPVMDRRGRVVAYGGRILPDHLRPPDQGDYTPAKYMNSSDTPLFHKGKMLYAESHARQAATEDKPVIVVEGYMDVIAANKVGFTGAVAPLGTALTEDQIIVLWKMIPADEKVPVLCFDGDNAGRRAAARAADRVIPMLRPGQSVKIAFLPEGQDPDTLVKGQGAKALERVIENAMPLADFLWAEQTAGKRFDTPEARAGLNKILEEITNRIPDRDVQFYYRQSFKDKSWKMFGPSGKGGKTHRPFGAPKTHAEIDGTSHLRRPSFDKESLICSALLACALNYPDILEEVEEDLGALAVSDVRLDALRQILLSHVVPEGLDPQTVQDYVKKEGFEGELRALLSEQIYTHAAFARPGRDREAVLEGWRQARQVLEKLHAQADLKRQA